jgi:hypothetical protein
MAKTPDRRRKAAHKAGRKNAAPPDFTSIGHPVDAIDVRLSYKIVELFSEGLYASPNKAIEELVANSFDAGADTVAVFLPEDFHAQGATIGVLDNGQGMDVAGLKRHWLIGISNKRELRSLPKGRAQIGKFGIGKLATYVLARRLTHISKKAGKFYSTSMDYVALDRRVSEGVEPSTPIQIKLRELTEDEAKGALQAWIGSSAFKATKLRLFGKAAEPSWTFAILSGLKDKVHELRSGTLQWVLRTALPLRDDFQVYLNNTELHPSKAGKGLIKRWVLGKDIKSLSKPAPGNLELSIAKGQPTDSPTHFGLTHKDLGRITGYAEAYEDLLTGKSDQLGRSYGFFVYVRDRLINVTDGHFGIMPDELRHGTFGRTRIVVHMDGLDELLQSDRERIREGPVLNDAQNVLRAIFNVVRPVIERHDAGEEPGAKLARKVAASPASVSRRPIVELARAALTGKIRSRYVALPERITPTEQAALIADLEARLQSPNQFVTGLEFVFAATAMDGLAVYDAVSGTLRINGLHPFIGAFFDEFTGKSSGLPLEIFAMAEVLLEAHLFQAGLKQDQIDTVMNTRDQFLRSAALESGRRTALSVANALRESRNDENRLEAELVESLRSLGFDATRIGGNGKPDGIARAHLSPSGSKSLRRYSVSLEAKSKKKEGTKLKTKGFSVSTIARHRDDFDCEHAMVIAPGFDHTAGKESTLAQEIKRDRESSNVLGKPKTITAMNIDDLARLVQLRPIKRIGLAKIRDMLDSCSLPEHCKAWIDLIEKTPVTTPPYKDILEAIHGLQKQSRNEPVGYGELRNELRHSTPAIDYADVDELIELCKGISQLAPGAVIATDITVELDQSVDNVLASIESAVRATIRISQSSKKERSS